MNILLIDPPAQGIYDSVDIKLPPLGLAYIAAVLRKNNHNVKIIDLNVDENLWGLLSERNWGLIGLSGDTSRYPVAMKIAEQIKKYYEYKIVTGGPHVTFFDKETLDTGVIDYVARGEGEYVMANLANALENNLDVAEIKGLSFERNGKLIRTESVPPIKDLDGLPFPARDLLSMKKYKITRFYGRPITNILTTRGCPFNCYFCSSSQFFGLLWRTRSPKNIVDEMEEVKQKYGYDAFAFVDDNFTLNAKRVIEISKEVLRRKLDVIWWAFSRVDELLRNEEMIKWMAKSGCKMIFLGIESVSKKILDEYNKRITANDSVKAMELLRKYGITTWGSFIIGALDETKEMILDTVRFAKLLNPRNVQFSVLTPFPGTRLYADTEKQGLIVHKNWEYYDGAHAVMHTKYLEPHELQYLLNRAYISFYIRPNRLIKILPTAMSYLMKLYGKRTRKRKIEQMIESGPKYICHKFVAPHT